jgi:RNA ligase (TIGR02306 family)
MGTFATPIVRVLSVEHHPNADRLSIVKILGYTAISGKLEDGSHRYKEGDLVVYIPSASILPEWLLKEMDFWDKEKNMGSLAGSNGDRVKPLRLRGIYSEGVLYPVKK